MSAFTPAGAHTALVTPFRADGAVDVDAFKRLVAFQRAEGIDGLVPCGTTGESPTLAWQEHDEVIELCVASAEGLSVLAGTGSNNTAEAIRGTEHARAAGVSAALIVDCYYNGPSSLELRTEYYERILNGVADVPIVPYIIPGRSGCALSAADLAHLHLAEPARVPAVKSATGDMVRMRRDRELAGDGLAVLSGDDDLTREMMADPTIGAAGVISVMSNIAPGTVAAMVRAQAAGDDATAARHEESLKPLLALVGCAVESTRTFADGRTATTTDKFRNPTPVKTMMAGLGMVGPVLRAPLGLMTAPAVARCREALRKVHSDTPAVLAPIGEAYSVDIAGRLGDDDVWSALTR